MVYTTHLWWLWGWFNYGFITFCCWLHVLSLNRHIIYIYIVVDVVNVVTTIVCLQYISLMATIVVRRLNGPTYHAMFLEDLLRAGCHGRTACRHAFAVHVLLKWWVARDYLWIIFDYYVKSTQCGGIWYGMNVCLFICNGMIMGLYYDIVLGI